VGSASLSYKGHRYPVEVISPCVWLYHRFPLSFREVEELMLERGIVVSYERIRRWCGKFGQTYASDLTHSQLLAVSAASNRSKGDQGPGRVAAAVQNVLVHLRPHLGVGEVHLRAVGDRERENHDHRHAGYLLLMNAHPPLPEQIVSKVKAGPGGAMTDERSASITGDLTVATRLLPYGHVGIAIQ